ncbi:MAG: hypothetical protein GEU86_21525 [Actinophytocola sp.]|nr:hypothetical protein [Actinophytocola sp.]
MTEITSRQDGGPTEAEAHAEPATTSHREDPLVQIELQGCPDAVPRMMVARSKLADEKLTLPFGNGYDHFAFDRYITRNGQLVPIYTWVDRTRIAE